MNQENVDLSLLTAATTTAQGAFASAGSIYPLAGSIGNTPAEAAATAPISEATNSNNYVAATELLFNEIKTFCNDFEAASYQHLTPPQSPPTSPLFAHQYQQQQQQYDIQNNNHHHQQQQPNICYVADAPSMTSSVAALSHFQCEDRSFVDLQLQSNGCLDKTFVIANQDEQPAPAQAPVDSDLLALELIDELLRNKTKDVHENYVLVNTQVGAEQQSSMVASRLNGCNEAAVQAITSLQLDMDDELDYCDDSATQFSTPSYGNSLASSPSRSGSSLDLEDSQDDDEWMPTAASTSSEGKMKKEKRGSSSSSGGSSSSKRRPYERGGGELEKKSRKKEQNKNAATRYRQKKKHEVDTILEEENRLKKTNKKLVTQFGEARRELKYLKNLLRDMYKQNDIII